MRRYFYNGKEIQPPAEIKNRLLDRGRAAWLWLHTEAEAGRLTAERITREFQPMIPNYGCSCLREWQEILQKNPLPATGQAQWAVDRHNDVNRKLGKLIWSY